MPAQWKVETVQDLKATISQYPVVGVINLFKMPSRQLQQMKRSLRDSAALKISRKNLIKLALEETSKENRKGLNELIKYIDGIQPALILTKMNPFKLYKILEKGKAKAPARAGDLAPYDITIPPGETPFTPGPVIGEFAKVGIITEVKGGKICISKETTVAKKGEPIRREVADILMKLGFEPMEIGLDLVAAYEDGLIFEKNVLKIDEQKIIGNIQQAYIEVINLAVSASIPNKTSINLLVQKAFYEVRNLVLTAGLPTPALMKEVIEKTHGEMLALASSVGSKDKKALDEELIQRISAQPVPIVPEKKEVKPEKKEEEKKEEAVEGLASLFG